MAGMFGAGLSPAFTSSMNSAMFGGGQPSQAGMFGASTPFNFGASGFPTYNFGSGISPGNLNLGAFNLGNFGAFNQPPISMPQSFAPPAITPAPLVMPQAAPAAPQGMSVPPGIVPGSTQAAYYYNQTANPGAAGAIAAGY